MNNDVKQQSGEAVWRSVAESWKEAAMAAQEALMCAREGLMCAKATNAENRQMVEGLQGEVSKLVVDVRKWQEAEQGYREVLGEVRDALRVREGQNIDAAAGQMRQAVALLRRANEQYVCRACGHRASHDQWLTASGFTCVECGDGLYQRRYELDADRVDAAMAALLVSCDV